MNKPMMDKYLATTTYKYIKILLRSDRIKTHVSCNNLSLLATTKLIPHYCLDSERSSVKPS